MAEEQILRLPAKLEGINEILNFVGSFLGAHGAAPKVCNQMRMPMEELCANVALYAYPSGDGWKFGAAWRMAWQHLGLLTAERHSTLWQSLIRIFCFPVKNAALADLAFIW